ncbi:MAG: enoyl-CoA hydratase/isomerase family protein [Chloroflexota bacterium]|nr:enoyl-CoA hydratase/isomerase family protein [Chloroflexota bacterium]
MPEPVRPGEASDRLAVELSDACVWVEEHVDPLTAVVLESTGEAFCVVPPGGAADCDAMGEVWAEATAAVGQLTAPVIAVLRGDAIGPAWDLALACDLRVASAMVHVGSSELRWGRMPSAGAIRRLTRIAGPSSALSLLLLANLLSAEEARELYLIHLVAAPSEADSCLADLLGTLRKAAPIALAYAKEAVLQAEHLSLTDGLRLEADLQVLLQTTRERAERLAAFVQRRQTRGGS